MYVLRQLDRTVATLKIPFVVLVIALARVAYLPDIYAYSPLIVISTL